MFIHANIHTNTYIHIFTHTKRNCSMYTAQTEVLTTITNKLKAQKLKFSVLRKPNTEPET